MPYLLNVDFPYSGPWGEAMSHAMASLAHHIAAEPGLIWKIWTEDQRRGRAGGVYLFENRDSAEAYLAMHTERLRQSGIAELQAQGYEVNLPLSALNRAPLTP